MQKKKKGKPRISIQKDRSIHITWLSHWPLTGIEAGLLTTTMSSSICTRVMGWLVTGTSCLQPYTRQAFDLRKAPDAEQNLH